MRVIEGGENLALVAEAGSRQFRAEVGAHDLERDLLLILAVGTGSAIDRTHAAQGDFLENFVGADTLAGEQPEMKLRFGGESRDGKGIECVRGSLFVGGD